jgi:uncharacterized protein (DUF1015 family)
MAEIRPFRALRFTERAGHIEELVCPPYDIISEQQRQAYLAANPHNIIRLELPRDGADPYATAGEVLAKWRADGILRQDDRPALYIYRIGFTANGVPMQVTGLIAQVHLEEFSKNIILPHEFTLSKAKTDRFNLMTATACNFSNIYSLYMASEGARTADDLIRDAALLNELTDTEGLTHQLWAVTDEAVIAEVCAGFADTRLFIADGHHRYETALNYRDSRRAAGAPIGGEADYVMMMLVEMHHPGLVVFPTHRLVRDVPDFDAARLLADCAAYFDTQALPTASLQAALDDAYAAGRKAFGFYDGTHSVLLTLRDTAVMDSLLPEVSPASRGLDVNVLHVLVLERLLGIDKENMANQKNLTYTRDAAEALQAVREGAAQCCFLLNPTRVSEIRDVAAAGEKMPQKSTYFYPKLITGLTINALQ